MLHMFYGSLVKECSSVIGVVSLMGSLVSLMAFVIDVNVDLLKVDQMVVQSA